MARTFKGRLNNREVLKLVTRTRSSKKHRYLVYDGDVFRKVDGRWRRMHYKTSRGGYYRVYLYHEGKRRYIQVHSLVWMAHTRFPIPHRFQVHHRDRDITNNQFRNLMCIHKLDHDKFHEEGYDGETPF